MENNRHDNNGKTCDLKQKQKNIWRINFVIHIGYNLHTNVVIIGYTYRKKQVEESEDTSENRNGFRHVAVVQARSEGCGQLDIKTTHTMWPTPTPTHDHVRLLI